MLVLHTNSMMRGAIMAADGAAHSIRIIIVCSQYENRQPSPAVLHNASLTNLYTGMKLRLPAQAASHRLNIDYYRC